MKHPSRLGPRRRAAVGYALLTLAASGCAVGPNHETPAIASPATHRGARDSGAREGQPEEQDAPTLADLPWWEVFYDPRLFALLKEATERAYDLRIAAERLDVARQQHRAASWALAPTLGVNGGVGDGVGTTSVPGVYPPMNLESHYGLGVSASWEPDVWGRLRRVREQALEDYLATEEDRRGVYIGLVGDVAELYFSLGVLDAQAEHARQAIEARRNTLTLFEARSAGGVGAGLEVERARANLKAAEAAAVDIALRTATTENTLSFLLARPPGPIERSPLERIVVAARVPAGLPSTLLRRRPDILVAEHRLAAANARIGIEKADFFPRFVLTGTLGVISSDLRAAQGVGMGAGLFDWTLPFLGGERVRAEYDAARASWRAAVALYERTCMNAFRDVASALANIEALNRRERAVREQVSALLSAEKLATERYTGGVANYLDVLTSQEQLLITQLDLDSLVGGQKIATARLYRALGGGWPKPPEDERAEGDEKN